ncbi:hypothetical protein Tco_1529110 [Tanacetum coccineum]
MTTTTTTLEHHHHPLLPTKIMLVVEWWWVMVDSGVWSSFRVVVGSGGRVVVGSGGRVVWISQKSQENSQKQANTDTRIRRVQKEAKDSKPKPEKSSLSQR